jgi:outer membrane protein insertion porin family
MIETDRKAIRNHMAQSGYLEADVVYNIALSEDSLAADVVFDANERNAIIAGDICVEGDVKVKEKAVLRECSFEKQDTLTRNDIRLTVDRLYKTGLFNLVALRYDSTNGSMTSGLRTVSVLVEEKKFFTAEIGGGVHSYEGLRASGEIGYNNLFGTGAGVRCFGNMSFVLLKAGAGFKFPWIFHLPVNFDVLASYRRQEERHIYTGLFGEVQTGVSGRLGRSLNYYLRHRFENVNLLESVVPASEIEDVPDKNTNSALVGINIDRRDDIIYPKRGVYSSADVEISGIGGAQVNHFVKMQASLRGYADFGTPLVFACAAKGGISNPFSPDTGIPIQERFYLGGSSTLRGFWQNQAGPHNADDDPTGGNAYLTLNVLEIRYPIYGPVSGVAFVDAGNLWYGNMGSLANTAKLININDLKYDAGAGIRVKLPIGMVRLDAAILFNPPGNEPFGAVHLDMGHAF